MNAIAWTARQLQRKRVNVTYQPAAPVKQCLEIVKRELDRHGVVDARALLEWSSNLDSATSEMTRVARHLDLVAAGKDGPRGFQQWERSK